MIVGRISTDPFGQMLRRHLEDAGVDLSMAALALEPTTLGVAAVDGHGNAEYSFYTNGTADWQWKDSELPEGLPADARALYVGGLALRLAPGAPKLEGLMGRTRRQDSALIFFDPNVRVGSDFRAAVERARVERQVALAHVVKASKDDIAAPATGLERVGTGVMRRLLERASASAAFTCERVGAESADAHSLKQAVRRAQSGPGGPVGNRWDAQVKLERNV